MITKPSAMMRFVVAAGPPPSTTGGSRRLPGSASLPTNAGLVILGDLSIQGNIKPLRSLAEPLQVAMDNGARKALILWKTSGISWKSRETS